MNAPALSAAVRPAPSFSTDLMSRLETASRVLLSPVALTSVEAWRQEAMQTVGAVFGAEQATFLIPGEHKVVDGWGLDQQTVDRVTEFVASSFQGQGSSPEPLLDEFLRRILAMRIQVWDMHSADHVLGGEGMAWNNLFHNEVLAPQRMADTHSLLVPMRGGAAHLAIHRFQRPPSPGEHLPLLRVLLPAFQAGIASIERLTAHRATLDAVEEPLAVFNADGMEVHRNAALTHLLARDPEVVQLERALARLAYHMRPFGFPLRQEHAGVPFPATAVQTAGARYTLRATLLPPGMYGTEGALLVTVGAETTGATLPSAETLRERFGLTKREAETTLLVAQGLSNDEIAERLFVSRHTVRHHVESLMAKLDLTGRGREAVAPRLINVDAGV